MKAVQVIVELAKYSSDRFEERSAIATFSNREASHLPETTKSFCCAARQLLKARSETSVQAGLELLVMNFFGGEDGAAMEQPQAGGRIQRESEK